MYEYQLKRALDDFNKKDSYTEADEQKCKEFNKKFPGHKTDLATPLDLAKMREFVDSLPYGLLWYINKYHRISI